jgi:hypothetical protein
MRGKAPLPLVVLLLPLMPAIAADPILPDQAKTPGAIDENVHGREICTRKWQTGDPPTLGGSLSYSKAARKVPESLKDQVFQEYGLQDPHDRGQSYEVDHRVPLALSGCNDVTNLLPESRLGDGFNAWIKDRLEYRLYTLVCYPKRSIVEGADPGQGGGVLSEKT